MDYKKYSEFLMKKQIEKIDAFIKETHQVAPIDNSGKLKTFYNYTEWSGWRFYLKAIRNRDWQSIKNHVKNTYLWNTKE